MLCGGVEGAGLAIKDACSIAMYQLLGMQEQGWQARCAASDNWPQCPAGMYQISGSAIEYILKEAREIGYQDLYIPSIGTHKSQAILCNSLTMMVYHKFTYVI
jgi:hypothetical protein